MQDLFKEGHNCWRKERADYVSMLVDCGNYYRDLRESILKAEKSIFILGWDIDSRIELIRGEDAEDASRPTKFFDLICWKARKNPELQIYLNRWDYSLFFMKQREPFWMQKWASCNLPNIHCCMDDILPLGACHHQKIVVVDDEVAFWGGMDVALGRWDFREHHVTNEDRADPGQLPHPGTLEHHHPYHDIQAVLAGPAAAALAGLVRERWRIAAPHIEPVPLVPRNDSSLPKSWPHSDPPDFRDVDVAIARTLPAVKGEKQVEEIYSLMLDEISRAENFIYIENQFLACNDIALALNKRLHERPSLRILAISCYNPQGAMEKRSMWGGRVKFRDLLEKGGVAGRTALAYPVCKEGNGVSPVRIHSKIMIIDDNILHLGSANINNRSMGMDTECDVSILGGDEASRHKIASVRNDLIREHTGFEVEVIDRIVNGGEPVGKFLEDRETSRQHLRPIDDEQYRQQSFMVIAKKIADPRRPILAAKYTRFPRFGKKGPVKGRSVWIVGAVVLLLAGLSLLWSHSPMSHYASIEQISNLFEQARNSPFSLLWVTLIYIGAGIVFFPVTVLSGGVILVFGAVKGFIYSLIGALASGLVGYLIGYAIGRERLQSLFPRSKKAMEKVRDSGVIGVAAIRTLPIAPYSLMNMIMGVVNVSMPAFILGTILGLTPGKLILAIFGESVTELFKNPDPQNILYAVLALAGWIAVILACNKLARGWQNRREQTA